METKRYNIIELQDLYLSTNKERYLNQLYEQLCKLGYKIIFQKNKLNMCDNDKVELVNDIVTSIILRLHKEQIPIITYPSAFLSRAIYFKSITYNKRVKETNYLIDDDVIEDGYDLEDTFFDKEITEEFYKFLDETILFYSSNLKPSDQELLKEEVITCFLLGRPYERYIYKLKRGLEQPFINIFEELKEYHKKYLITTDKYIDGEENKETM